MLLSLLFAAPMQGVFQPANIMELKTGVNAWMRNPAKARVYYGGEIGNWDVSRVTSMNQMLCGPEWCGCGDLCMAYWDFNEPLNS